MASTTDFEAWLEDGNEPDTDEEAYALACAAEGEDGGFYDVTTDFEGGPFY